MKRLALTIAACAALPGCHAGMVSEWSNPHFPIRGSDKDLTTTGEAGGGPGGAIARTNRGQQLRIANGRHHSYIGALPGASIPKIDGDRLYFRDGDRLLRRAVAGRPSSAVEVAQVPGLRGFDVSDGAALLLAKDGVYFQERGGEARRVWRGTALAIAYEPERGKAWIAARRPLPVVEILDLASGEPSLRVPLPLELDDPNLVLVVSSPRGALTIPGASVAIVLFIDPQARTTRLLADELGSFRRKTRFIASEPPVVEPPGEMKGERLSLPSYYGRYEFTGRLAALPDGEFALIDNRPGPDRLTITRIDARLKTSVYSVPDDYPRAVDAVGWDDRGAYVLGEGRCLRIDRDRVSEVRLHGWGPGARRLVNRGLNGLIFAAELVLSLPANTALCSLLAPFGAIGALLGGGKEAVLVALSPLWFPISYSFTGDL